MNYQSLLATLLMLSINLIASGELQLEKGDRICLVGNELGERMQHHNYWETLLYQAYPQHDLSVRNLCFPGDEPTGANPLQELRLRPTTISLTARRR